MSGATRRAAAVHGSERRVTRQTVASRSDDHQAYDRQQSDSDTSASVPDAVPVSGLPPHLRPISVVDPPSQQSPPISPAMASLADIESSSSSSLFTGSPMPSLKPSSNLLKIHACRHGDCDKRFARKSDLARHERIHTADKPYQCSMCGKRFIQTSALKVHERSHTGEKPFECEYCAKCFSDTSSLVRHRRVHTGERPYHCSIPQCPFAFCRKSSLQRHEWREHNIPLPADAARRMMRGKSNKTLAHGSTASAAVRTSRPLHTGQATPFTPTTATDGEDANSAHGVKVESPYDAYAESGEARDTSPLHFAVERPISEEPVVAPSFGSNMLPDLSQPRRSISEGSASFFPMANSAGHLPLPYPNPMQPLAYRKSSIANPMLYRRASQVLPAILPSRYEEDQHSLSPSVLLHESHGRIPSISVPHRRNAVSFRAAEYSMPTNDVKPFAVHGLPPLLPLPVASHMPAPLASSPFHSMLHSAATVPADLPQLSAYSVTSNSSTVASSAFDDRVFLSTPTTAASAMWPTSYDPSDASLAVHAYKRPGMAHLSHEGAYSGSIYAQPNHQYEHDTRFRDVSSFHVHSPTIFGGDMPISAPPQLISFDPLAHAGRSM